MTAAAATTIARPTVTTVIPKQADLRRGSSAPRHPGHSCETLMPLLITTGTSMGFTTIE